MGCHFCSDELFAVFMVLGGIRYIPIWIKSVWGRRHDVCSNPKHEHSVKRSQE